MMALVVDAAQLHQRAVTLMNDGDYEAASDLLDEARTLTDDPDTLARIDLTAAYIASQQGSVRAGIERCHALLNRQGLNSESRGLSGRSWACCTSTPETPAPPSRTTRRRSAFSRAAPS